MLAGCLVFGGFPLEAKTAKTAAPKSRKTGTKTSSKSPSSKTSAVKKKPTSSAKSRRTSKPRTVLGRARRSTPPRQMRPTNERYMEIQQALADKGHYTGEIDGVWDAACIEALKQFQAEQNLTPDGKLGSLSLIALGLGPKREPLPPQFAAKPESGQ